MKVFELKSELLVPAPLDRVFSFFADAANLERITPPWLRFHILTPVPVAMAEGTVIDYRMSLHGLPLRWKSRIDAWEPPHRFVDRQLRGPYRMWVHEHSFIPRGDHTLCRDHVRYAVPGGALVERLLVRRDVRRIFHHRRRRLEAIFR